MIVRESIFRDVARLMVWYPIRIIIGLLPVRWAFALFRVPAWLHMRFGGKRLDRLRTNIHRAFPTATDAEVSRIIHVYLNNHYLDRLHIFSYPGLGKAGRLSTIGTMNGIGNLDEALAGGKGAIIVLGHAGPIQLPLFHLGQAGYPVIQVGLPTDEGLSWIGRHVSFRLRLRYERMIPARILPAGDFLRPLFLHLKQNGVVMMNIDPAGGGKWLGRLAWHPFFGHTIPFPMGSALLAQKTGAPVLPLSIHRSDDGRYRFCLHPPRHVEFLADTAPFVRSLIGWYEQVIADDPGLWHFWDEFEDGKLIRSATPIHPEVDC